MFFSLVIAALKVVVLPTVFVVGPVYAAGQQRAAGCCILRIVHVAFNWLERAAASAEVFLVVHPVEFGVPVAAEPVQVLGEIRGVFARVLEGGGR